MKDNKSLLLILLTAGLVITWVYHIYDKSRDNIRANENSFTDSLALVQAISDSLKREYTQTFDSIGSQKMQTDSATDSLKNELTQKIEEVNQLRKEIDEILEKKNLTQVDLNDANRKLKLFQQRMEGLRTENSVLAEESKRLNKPLAQSAREKNTTDNTGTERPEISKFNAISTFTISGIRFVALSNEQQESETSQVSNAQKFICSFQLQNNKTDVPQAEVFIVITDPAGKTVNTEVWDAGSFDTRTEGKKVFTRKMKFDYRKGEAKKISVTIEPEVFEKGIYMIGIYHNGISIGASSWELN